MSEELLELNKYIDHTLLRPEVTHKEFERFLDEAVKYQFAAVCVSPYMAGPIKAALKGEDIKVASVVGFPLGIVSLDNKVREISYLIERSIDEIDFVINIGNLKSERYDDIGLELDTISQICRNNNIVSKCIVETCYLTHHEKSFMFKALNENTLIDYIKTSTGYGTQGAQLIDVLNWNTQRQQSLQVAYSSNDLIQLLPVDNTKYRDTPLKIKAAGGIREFETVLKFINCGADRIGTSSSVKVMEEFNARKSPAFIEREEKT